MWQTKYGSADRGFASVVVVVVARPKTEDRHVSQQERKIDFCFDYLFRCIVSTFSFASRMHIYRRMKFKFISSQITGSYRSSLTTTTIEMLRWNFVMDTNVCIHLHFGATREQLHIFVAFEFRISKANRLLSATWMRLRMYAWRSGLRPWLGDFYVFIFILINKL